MMDIPDYIPGEHAEVFREWLLAIHNKYRLSDKAVVDKTAAWLTAEKKRAGDSRGSDDSTPLPHWTTIKRIRLGKRSEAGAESGEKLKKIWNFFRAHAEYKQHFPVTQRSSLEPLPADPLGLLGVALNRFFGQEARLPRYSADRMKQLLVGRFVMYRQDFELAGRRQVQPPYIRASRVDIWENNSSLLFRETQNFKAQPEHRRPKHRQVNNGVLFPYGDYAIGLMNAEEATSFKCVVIDEISSHAEPGSAPTEDFKGKMLVASDRGLFPSALFFCRRGGQDEGRDQHGILERQEVDEDIVRYLSTPTFRDDFNPTY